MPEPLVMVGAGGFGREALDVAQAMTTPDGQCRWDVLGVADDSPSDANLERLAARDIAYLGTVDDVLASTPDARYVVGIGSQVELGAGTVVCAGARLTTNIRLGRHVHVNPNVTIGHDTVLGDFVSLNPSASISGDVTLGDDVLIGVSGVVLNLVTIGSKSTVGGSACVVRDVPDGVVVKGVPAR